jgi:BRCT domain type II-containing protein
VQQQLETMVYVSRPVLTQSSTLATPTGPNIDSSTIGQTRASEQPSASAPSSWLGSVGDSVASVVVNVPFVGNAYANALTAPSAGAAGKALMASPAALAVLAGVAFLAVR